MIKRKSVAYYFADEFGGVRAVSKNAVTRLQNKIRSKDFLKAGQLYSMTSHKVVGKKNPGALPLPPNRKWFSL